MLDAEHFFDGYKEDPGYALACLEAAREAGARWIVLCDTNGGTLPHEVEAIVGRVSHPHPARAAGHPHPQRHRERGRQHARGGPRRGPAGAGHDERARRALRQRQPGQPDPDAEAQARLRNRAERRGLRHLTQLSRTFDERLNRTPNRHAAYVGASAFAHKAGLHASAVAKDPRFYEHIDPSAGRQRARRPGLGPGRPLQPAAPLRRDGARGRPDPGRRPSCSTRQGARGRGLGLRRGRRPASSCWSAPARPRCPTTSTC